MKLTSYEWLIAFAAVASGCGNLDPEASSPQAATQAADAEPAIPPTFRFVNQKTGPYLTIAAAIAESNPKDAIVITDSATYDEQITMDKPGLYLLANSGERPVISGHSTSADGAVVTVTAPDCQLKDLTIYVDGAHYGIDAVAKGTNIERVSFDVHIAPRGTTATFALHVSADATVTRSDFLGQDGHGKVLNGGILVDSSTPIQLVVTRSDFWGVGASGGAIGMGMAADSTAIVMGCVFGNYQKGDRLVGINSWGSGTITEVFNAFRNIDIPVRNLGAPAHDTDHITAGGVAATDTDSQVGDAQLDSLISSLGCTPATSFAHPQPATVRSMLDRSIKTLRYDRYSESALPDYRSFVNSVAPKLWASFTDSWARQFDPSVWNGIRIRIQDLRAQPNLSNVVFGGYLMESISKANIEHTPIERDLWIWAAYNFPEISSRPLIAKTVNARRWQAHWFDYDVMLGALKDHWGTDNSVPNLNKHEAVIYYLHLAHEMIDAGMGLIQLAQPHLTFGQNLSWDGWGSGNFERVTRFVKNYGACAATPISGTRFGMVGAATIMFFLKGAGRYVDFVMSPAAADAAGAGLPWNTLADSSSRIPPASAGIDGKPLALELDHSGSEQDQMTVFAKAAPADRNRWITQFDAEVRRHGYFLMQTGVRNIAAPQSFAGYPDPGTAAWLFNPYDKFSGYATTAKKIFNSH